MESRFEVGPEAVARRGAQLVGGYDRWLATAGEAAATSRAAWQPDLSTAEAYLASCEPQRRALRNLLRLEPEPAAVDPSPSLTPVGTFGPHSVTQLIYQPWAGAAADALVLSSDGRPRPTVVACHALSSTPEQFCGLSGPSETKSLVAGLLAAGFTVVVPRLVTGWPARRRLARHARLLGFELLGLEVTALRRLLDVVVGLEPVDAASLGVYGFSRGGQAALLLASLDERLAAVALGGWLTDRVAKLLDNHDSRFVSYLDSPEAEQFVPGWLADFTDVELAALVAPEPLLITHGLDDPVAPFEQVESTVEALAGIYDGLGWGELLELDLFVGGHLPAVESTVRFFSRWLNPPALAREPAANLAFELPLEPLPWRRRPRPVKRRSSPRRRRRW